MTTFLTLTRRASLHGDTGSPIVINTAHLVTVEPALVEAADYGAVVTIINREPVQVIEPFAEIVRSLDLAMLDGGRVPIATPPAAAPADEF